MIVASSIFVPISAISFAMVLVGSYGTAHMDPFQGLVVIAGPPATVVAGVGLLRRWRWAWAYLLVALVGIITWSTAEIIEGPSPARIYTSADGVRNTISATEVNYPFHVTAIVVSVGLGAFLLSRSVRSEFGMGRNPPPPADRAVGAGPPGLPAFASRPEAASPSSSMGSAAPNLGAAGSSSEDGREWRVGHRGRDAFYYEERHGGAWQRLEIDGEMLAGRPHHVIYFSSDDAWQRYPAWARHRRDAIIARITSEFRPPDYEYVNDVSPTGGAPLRVPVYPAGNPVRPKPSRALAIAMVVLLTVAGGMFWLVQSGIGKGETYFPSNKGSLRRIVSREAEPALFWVSIGLYAAIGGGTLGLAVWGFRVARKDGGRGRT